MRSSSVARASLAACVLLCTSLVAPVAAAPVRSSAFLDRDRNRITDDLDRSLARDGSFDVIVQTLGAPSSIPGRVRARWSIVDAVAARMTRAQIRALARRSDVVQIETDRPVHTTIATARRYEGVDKAVTDFNVNGDGNGNRKSFTTADVVACVIDTGVDTAHVDLDQGQVLAWKDLVNGRATPYDDNGHGSHVAGILAGQGDGDWSMRGVAYGTALVAVKALSASGSASSSTLISAIQWCVNARSTYHIKIMTMSFGSSAASDGTDTLSQAVNAAADAGILPVVAAGNTGPAQGTIGSPAAATKALTVCSLADPGEHGFSVSPFSSRGPTLDGRIKPDLCAPGTNITSVKAGTGNGYVTLSGTSMATPFVAGVAALLLDANPSLTEAQLRGDLLQTAQDWRTSGADIDTGRGRLQAYEAVKLAGGFSGTGPLVPKHYSAGSASLRSAGARDVWHLPLTSTSYPVAATMIDQGSSASKDFDVFLYDPSGTLRASGATTARQETAAWTPTVTGTYTLVVESYAGSGTYYLDLSYGGSTPVLASDG